MAYPYIEAIDIAARPNPATNMQSVEMLRLNNLLEQGNNGSRLLQNPMAQFLPPSMSLSGQQQMYSFAYGGSSKTRNSQQKKK